MEKIVIDITENDLEDFKDVVYLNKNFRWTFTTDAGTKVEIEFISEDEAFQREQ